MLFRTHPQLINFHTLRRSASRIAPRGRLEVDEHANLSGYKLTVSRKNRRDVKWEVIER
jgi:hypothetical protein